MLSKNLVEEQMFCSYISDGIERSRALANIVALKTAFEFFKKCGLKPGIEYSAHKIKKVFEELDVSDFYIGELRIDVRLGFGKGEYLIPRKHYELEITPDLYLFVDYNTTVEKAEIAGFIEPSKIDKSNYDNYYYIIPKSAIVPADKIEALFNSIVAKAKNGLPLNFKKKSILYLDNQLLDTKEFCQDLMNYEKARQMLLEFEQGEDILNSSGINFENNDTAYSYLGEEIIGTEQQTVMEDIDLGYADGLSVSDTDFDDLFAATDDVVNLSGSEEENKDENSSSTLDMDEFLNSSVEADEAKDGVAADTEQQAEESAVENASISDDEVDILSLTDEENAPGDTVSGEFAEEETDSAIQAEDNAEILLSEGQEQGTVQEYESPLGTIIDQEVNRELEMSGIETPVEDVTSVEESVAENSELSSAESLELEEAPAADIALIEKIESVEENEAKELTLTEVAPLELEEALVGDVTQAEKIKSVEEDAAEDLILSDSELLDIEKPNIDEPKIEAETAGGGEQSGLDAEILDIENSTVDNLEQEEVENLEEEPGHLELHMETEETELIDRVNAADLTSDKETELLYEPVTDDSELTQTDTALDDTSVVEEIPEEVPELAPDDAEELTLSLDEPQELEEVQTEDIEPVIEEEALTIEEASVENIAQVEELESVKAGVAEDLTLPEGESLELEEVPVENITQVEELEPVEAKAAGDFALPEGEPLELEVAPQLDEPIEELTAQDGISLDLEELPAIEPLESIPNINGAVDTENAESILSEQDTEEQSSYESAAELDEYSLSNEQKAQELTFSEFAADVQNIDSQLLNRNIPAEPNNEEFNAADSTVPSELDSELEKELNVIQDAPQETAGLDIKAAMEGFVNSIEPDETIQPASSKDAETAVQSNAETELNDAQEDVSSEAENLSDEIDELYTDDGQIPSVEKPAYKKKKKSSKNILGGVLVLAVALGVAGFLNKDIIMEKIQGNTSVETVPNELAAPAEAQSVQPPKKTEVETEAEAMLEDIEEPVQLLDTSVSISAMTVECDVPSVMVNTHSRRYLIKLAKRMQLQFKNALLIASEQPLANKIVVDLSVDKDVIKYEKISSSSGSKKVDEIAASTAKNILKNTQPYAGTFGKNKGIIRLIVKF